MSEALLGHFRDEDGGFFIFSTCAIGLRTALFRTLGGVPRLCDWLLLLLIIGNWK